MKIKKLLKLLLTLLLIFSLSILIFSLFTGRESFIDYLLSVINKIDRKEDTLHLISKKSFTFIQAGLCIISLLITVLIIKFDLVYRYIHKLVNIIISAFKTIWIDIKTKNALFVLIIPFSASIYFGLTIPISYDEAYTYLTFTSKPFYYCMVFYPFPNNHILHSLLTNITEHIPFVDMLFRIRVPAILASILTWAIAYSFVKRYYSEKTAMFVVALSSMLFLSVYYSYMSRGYALVVLFFVIGLYSAYNIIRKGNRRKDWLIFSISGVLGFYTMPSYLYPFVTLNIFIFLYNYKEIKKQIIYGIITGISVIILYLPIIVVSGLKVLTGNQFVTPKSSRLEVLQHLPSFFGSTLQEISGIPFWIVLAIMVAAVILFIVKKDKWNLSLSIIFILAPFVFLFLQSVIPFPRTFVYYGFMIVFFAGIAFSDYINRIRHTYLVMILITIQIAGFISFYLNIGRYESFNTTAKVINEKIAEDGKAYYIPNTFPDTNLEYEIMMKGYKKKPRIKMYPYNTFVNADTASTYDYVIINADYDKTVSSALFYHNPESNLNIYKKE